MNKQEAIEKIKNLKGITILDKTINFDSEMIPKGDVLEIIEQIDEPEKTVLPQFIADWLEVCKENIGFSLSSAMSHSTSLMKAQPNKVQGWFNLKDNQETFAKAWLFGYEVKKEKLYEVFLKRTGDQLGVCVPHGEDKTQFTKVELQEYGFDNLDVYENVIFTFNIITYLEVVSGG